MFALFVVLFDVALVPFAFPLSADVDVDADADADAAAALVP